MNITIFGATGSIGRLLVEQALAAGHDVTAFTRDAAGVTAHHDRLQVVEGDVTDPAACLPAVKDADAVMVVLGGGRQGRLGSGPGDGRGENETGPCVCRGPSSLA